MKLRRKVPVVCYILTAGEMMHLRSKLLVYDLI